MKIGFDAKRAFNNSTGLGNYSRFVISSLIKFYPENEYYLFTPRVSNRFKNYFTHQENVKIITPEKFIHKKFPATWRSIWLTKILEKHKIDLFHGLSNELPHRIAESTVKSVVTIHDLIFLRFPQYYNFIDKRIYKKKFRRAAQNADSVISVSQQTKSDIVDFFGISNSKINVIYQNCDEVFNNKMDVEFCNIVKRKYGLSEKYILSVGTIEERKNQLTLVKSIGKIEDKSVKIVLAGNQSDYVNKIKRYISKNKLADRVVFIPYFEKAELPSLYQSAICSVYISEFEGFGIPVLESMRCGTPTIISNNSSLPEVGGNACLQMDTKDNKRLASLINSIISDVTLRENCIKNGLEQVEKFNAEKISSEIINLYKSLI